LSGIILCRIPHSSYVHFDDIILYWTLKLDWENFLSGFIVWGKLAEE
jgi:hypothetical protein